MSNDFRNAINAFYQGTRDELRRAQSITSPVVQRQKQAPEEYEVEGEEIEIEGQGIASYKHVRGGSISSFVERMHDNINIKSIVKYNKSAYVISI